MTLPFTFAMDPAFGSFSGSALGALSHGEATKLSLKKKTDILGIDDNALFIQPIV